MHTSAQLLESVLNERPHLNLSGKVQIDGKAVSFVFGGFADFYKGFYIGSAKHVAVKRLRLHIRASKKITRDLAKQIQSWSELEHPNVLPLLGYISHVGSNYPALVCEWMEEGSLRDCMTGLNRYEALSMVLGIAKGLAYLHSKDIIHSNLKSDNVLISISPKKQALLTDFGISQMTSLSTGYNSDTVKGSGRWQAMEFFSLSDARPPRHTIATDVWAFGMTIYELLSYDLPYAHIKHRDQVTLVISRGFLPKFPNHCATSTGLNKVLENALWCICIRCWNADPEVRPNISEIVGELEVVERCGDKDYDKFLSNLLQIQSFQSPADMELPVVLESDVSDDAFALSSHGEISNPGPIVSSIELLARVLQSRAHLDLSNEITVDQTSRLLIRGGYADVYQGYFIKDKQKVAVKRIQCNIGHDEKMAKYIANEIRIWSDLVHPNILPLLGYCMEGGYPSFISDWMENGSLLEYAKKLKRRECILMALGIARGMAYIHSRKAIHSDLKSANVLVSPDGHPLLTDFGISEMDTISAGYTTHSFRGSTRWQAIEFFDVSEDLSLIPQHTTMTDVWAFGMTVYELLTHELPFYNIQHIGQLILHISRGGLPKKPELSNDPVIEEIELFLWLLCCRCWQKDPTSRPSMSILEKEIDEFMEILT